MESQSPFFKPKVIKKTQLDVESNSKKLSRTLSYFLFAMAVLLIGMLIVYLLARNDAPEVKIQTETTK